MTYQKTIAPFQIPAKIEAAGATAPDGRPFVRIKASGRIAWIPRSAFMGQGQAASRHLRDCGIPLLTDEFARARKLVSELDEFPVGALVDRIGWSWPHFALPDGKVYSPSSLDESVVLFKPDKERMRRAGTMAAWRRLTAELAGQHIPTFILMSAFAAPLLSHAGLYANVGFEIAGPGGTGKSTVLQLAAAVCGPVDNAKGRNYWMTANATINGLEEVMRESRDLPLIIDETNLFAAADNLGLRAAKFNELVFRLADGTEKRRRHTTTTTRSRFVFLTSTNEPLMQLLESSRVTVADAATDRLLSIPVESHADFGAFSFVPRKWESAAALADHLSNGVRQVYGVSMRHFLRRLVTSMDADESTLRKQLKSLMKEFREKVGVNENNGSETRVADSFGLVYAAGELALETKSISKHLDPMSAAIHCYQKNRQIKSSDIDHVSRLKDIADDFETPIINFGRLRDFSDDELDQCPGLIWNGRGGVSELLLTRNQLVRAFPNLPSFFKDSKVRDIILGEDGRRTTKRRIRSNRQAERFYVFRLSAISQNNQYK